MSLLECLKATTRKYKKISFIPLDWPAMVSFSCIEFIFPPWPHSFLFPLSFGSKGCLLSSTFAMLPKQQLKHTCAKCTVTLFFARTHTHNMADQRCIWSFYQFLTNGFLQTCIHMGINLPNSAAESVHVCISAYLFP